MRTFINRSEAGLMLMAIVLSLGVATRAQKAKPQAGINVPVTYYKLGNGLKVVLSPERSAPLATIAVYYNIGFRIEPRDRTGFAHLFEHLMFQGSKNLGKMEYIRLVESNGGVLNGSTRFDFTNYFAVVPSHKVETLLWAEADRMRGLDITQENLKNQQSHACALRIGPESSVSGSYLRRHEGRRKRQKSALRNGRHDVEGRNADAHC